MKAEKSKREARRNRGDIVWKVAGAGFLGVPGYAELTQGPSEMGCFVCDDRSCVEWDTVWMLAGETYEEAVAAKERGEYLGAAYHVGECQMRDRREGEDDE